MTAEEIFGRQEKWECPHASLTILPPKASDASPVEIDVLPVRGSTATQPGGETVTIVSEAEFLAGIDARDVLVMLDPMTDLRREVLSAILDRGGRGFISDFTPDPFAHPDEIPHLAVPTEATLSDDAETRPFTGFAVSPRMGMRMRAILSKCPTRVRIECDARRFPLTSVALPASRTGIAMGLLMQEVAQKAACGSRAAFRSWAVSWHRHLATSVRFASEEHKAAALRRFDNTVRSHWALMPPETDGKGASVTKDAIVAALYSAGVRSGDLILVHSSLSACGHIEGGAETVLDALAEAVGADGTVLLPAFACCFRVFDCINKRWGFRPYDPHDPDRAVWIGKLSTTFMRLHPEAPNSGHCTNAWTGFGAKAAACLAGHAFDDEPYSERSPLAKALAAHGKVVFLGADVKSCTFLHYIEDRADAPGIGPAMASAKDADGRIRNVVFRRHSPGDREFYEKGEESRFFTAAREAGLEIRRAPLGRGLVKCMDLESLYRIGLGILLRDPAILMCNEQRDLG